MTYGTLFDGLLRAICLWQGEMQMVDMWYVIAVEGLIRETEYEK